MGNVLNGHGAILRAPQNRINAQYPSTPQCECMS
jgi:hypothetical protein